MNKTLVIIRHAHRNKFLGREKDNGLSKRGKDQAAKLNRYFSKRYGGKKPLIISSQTKRCVETVARIAQNENVKITLSPLLIEQGGIKKNESRAAINRRIRKFCNDWKRSRTRLTVICSHGDWIPECIEMLTGANSYLRKGAWAEVSIEEGKPSLNWLIQEF